MRRVESEWLIRMLGCWALGPGDWVGRKPVGKVVTSCLWPFQSQSQGKMPSSLVVSPSHCDPVPCVFSLPTLVERVITSTGSRAPRTSFSTRSSAHNGQGALKATLTSQTPPNPWAPSLSNNAGSRIWASIKWETVTLGLKGSQRIISREMQSTEPKTRSHWTTSNWEKDPPDARSTCPRNHDVIAHSVDSTQKSGSQARTAGMDEDT